MFSILDGIVYVDFLWVKVKFREEDEKGHFSVFTKDGGESFLWCIGNEIQLAFHHGVVLCARHCAEFSGGRIAASSHRGALPAAAGSAGGMPRCSKQCGQGQAKERPSLLTQKHGETFLWRR